MLRQSVQASRTHVIWGVSPEASSNFQLALAARLPLQGLKRLHLIFRDYILVPKP